MTGNTIALICHTVIALALILAFVATGEMQVLVGLLGYLGGAGAQAASKSAK